MKSISNFVFIFITAMPLCIGASALASKVKPSPEGARANLRYVLDAAKSVSRVHVGYSLGTYHIPNKEMQGTMELSQNAVLMRVSVTAPIGGFKSNDTTLDCHLRESLGLDYQVSDFPDSHVCVHDRLPESGKNAVKFPDIRFEFHPTEAVAFGSAGFEGQLKGNWNIHGVEQPQQITVKVTKTDQGYRVEGSQAFSLKDFSVTVKKFLFVAVDDQIKTDWDLTFIGESKK